MSSLMQSRRSPEFLLSVFGALLVVCLVAVLYGHVHYTAAENVYRNHLQHVVIGPHTDVKAELNTYALAADKWLRIRTAASMVAAGVSVGMLWQVIRRRNRRLGSVRVEAEVA